MTGIARAGLQAIDAGWSVLLTGPRHKRPHWRTPTVHDATRDRGLFEAWALENPDCGLAVNLGASNLAAIEDDGPEGLALLVELEALHGPLPATWMIQARLGHHRLYRTSGEVRSRRLARKLELRARGEYSLIPPTTVDGVTRRWIAPQPREPIASLPFWLVAEPATQSAAAVEINSTSESAQAALDEARGRLAFRPARPGTGRGTALFAAACSLGRHVHAGTLERDVAEDALREAGAALRLTRYERDRSIERGLALGPRRAT